MEKDRTRRYASASEFAADLRRHLTDEPVVARPASIPYRGWKFARRHRAGVAASATAFLLLLAAGTTLAVQSRRVAAERDRASAISAFLVSLFEASDPDRSKGEKVSARQLLDRGRQRLDSELGDQPQTRATLLHTIGRVYRALDLNDVAATVLTQALELRRGATGRDRADLADTMNELARVYTARGDPDRAESLDTEVVRLRREVFGMEHPKVAQSVNNLGVEPIFRRALDIRRAAGEKPGHGPAESLERLGQVLCERNAREEGETLARQALEIRRNAAPPAPSRLAVTEAVVGRCLAAGRRFEEAEVLLTKAHATLVTERGETQYAVASLVALYDAWRKPDQAAEWRLKLR